jgi:hypothetical protein
MIHLVSNRFVMFDSDLKPSKTVANLPITSKQHAALVHPIIPQFQHKYLTVLPTLYTTAMVRSFQYHIRQTLFPILMKNYVYA